MENILIDSAENQENNKIFKINILIKCLHVILRKYPVLLPTIVKFNCSKYYKNPIIPNKNTTTSNFSFLSFLTLILIPKTFNKFHHLLFEFCLDSSLLQINNHGKIVSFGSEVRKKVLGDIYSILEQSYEQKNPNFEENLNIFCSLHCYLMPIKELTSSSINDFSFIKFYVDTLKTLSPKNFYIYFEKIFPFIIETVSILYQYSIHFVMKSGTNDDKVTLG